MRDLRTYAVERDAVLTLTTRMRAGLTLLIEMARLTPGAFCKAIPTQSFFCRIRQNEADGCVRLITFTQLR